MKTEFAPFDISDHLDSDEMIAGYLTAAAEDEDPNVLLGALAHVAKAHGMTQVAKAAGTRPREPVQDPRAWIAPAVRNHSGDPLRSQRPDCRETIVRSRKDEAHASLDGAKAAKKAATMRAAAKKRASSSTSLRMTSLQLSPGPRRTRRRFITRVPPCSVNEELTKPNQNPPAR